MKKAIIATLVVIGLLSSIPAKTFAVDSGTVQTQSQGQSNNKSNTVSCPDGCVPTAILGDNHCVCDDGKGSSIIDILKFVVNIMSVGVGILGVIGITVVGVQYLTAGGNEEKTRTAKRRIFEIVIGLVAYAAAYALLYWLLPGFSAA